MNRIPKNVAVCVALACLSAAPPCVARSKNSKPGPLTGTWTCVSHGRPEGDVPFTLYLEQTGEIVTGTVSSSQGSTELNSADFKKGELELHIDSPDGEYLLTAKLHKGQLTGQWSFQNNKGPWEGKKEPAPPKSR